MFDIAIVGGNLAGLYAAINAANKGIKVALIEKNREPYLFAHCGEGIADVAAELLNLKEFGCYKNEIDQVVVNISYDKKYNFKLSRNKIFTINRSFLEKQLIMKAEKIGVKLFLGRKMIKFNPPYELVLDNNTSIKGKIIIDASGIICAVGKQLGINVKLKPKDIGVCIQSRVLSNFDSNIIYMWFHNPYAPFGYSWLFPYNEKEANIGLGIPGGQKIDLRKLLSDYIHFVTKGEFKIKYTFRACEPMSLPLDSLVKDNVMFVGDAGRLVESASGAGIHNAVFSGTLAGILSKKLILNEIDSLELYNEAMNKKIKKLKKTYYAKNRLNTSSKYIKGFNTAFYFLNIANRISPNFFQGHVAKRIRKDIDVIKKYS